MEKNNIQTRAGSENSQISDIQHEVEAETETAETNTYSSLSYYTTPLPSLITVN